jgi:hypothetical protein
MRHRKASFIPIMPKMKVMILPQLLFSLAFPQF